MSEGLPQSFVSGIVQGENDFIWISTRNGLVRFDGNEFRSFQHDPNNSSSISSNLILNIKKGIGNRLFIRMEAGGIDVLDLNTEKNVRLIDEGFLKENHVPQNNWLIASDNSFWFFSESNKLSKYPSGKTSREIKTFLFPNDTIRTFFEDKKEQIWVLTENSLSILDTNNCRKNFKVPFDLSYRNKVEDAFDKPGICQKTNGNIVWTDRISIIEFSPNTQNFKRTFLPFPLNQSLAELNYKKEDDKIYFLINKKLYSYKDNVFYEAEIPLETSKDIKHFLVDNAGLVWIAIDTDGVYQIDYANQFKNFEYKEDFVFDLLKEIYNIFPKDIYRALREGKFELSPSYYLRSDIIDNQNWIAINQDVYRYDFEENTHVKLPLLNNFSEDKFNPIEGITLINKDKPVVIQNDGQISFFDFENDSWQPLFSAQNIDIGLDPNGLLYANNALWITTRTNGLFYVKLDGLGSLQKINIPISNLTTLVKDTKNSNILWIGSHSGLIKLNTRNFKSEIFSTTEGLPDNTIYSILKDKSGNLWLGTNRGLCRFNTKNHRIKNFTLQHGLPFLEYNRHHSLYLPDGNLAFGGAKEGVVFNPETIKEDVFLPSTAITAIEVNNEEREGSLPANHLTHLNLAHQDNNLIIKYSALQYNQPTDNNYRYRLKGYDQDDSWILAGKRRQAIYTQLPPGEYTFEVNSSNTSGKWSDKTKALGIIITPPWWNTPYAWIIYILAFIFLIVLFIKYRVKQKLIFKEVEFKRKEALRLKELDEVKTRFFSNVTHELRTPLSLILGPVEKLKRNLKSDEDLNLLELIFRNGRNLLDLTNQLLDFSKIEAGVLKPVYSSGDLNAVIEKNLHYFDEELKTKNINLVYENSVESLYVFSKEFFERIINNLISNAIKYNIEGGEIFVSLKEKRKGILLTIKDSGIGISSENLPHIFTRYYREDSISPKIEGTGIGLSFVAELVKIQKGTIEVDSTTGAKSGTSFMVFLPYEKIKKEKKKIKETDGISGKAKEPKILLVEDNEDIRSFIASELAKDYKLYIAADGKEGFEKANEVLPDMVLTDVMMNEMDGLQLCKAIKENKLTSHIPVILLTARADIESKIDGLSVGADDYIYKPFNLQELALRIKNLLESKKQQREYIYKKFTHLPEPGSLEVPVPQQDSFMETVYQVLDSNINNENFGVVELAAALNLSRTSLHRKVKAVTDLTTGQIIKIYRLKKAVNLLHQNYNVSEVSFQTGFGSPSYFTKCFKEVYGITPSVYLEKIKGGKE